MMTPDRKFPLLRDSNIELLRIVSMVMIVSHHFAVHGAYRWGIADISIPHLWIAALALFGEIGVNVFVLISGYYLIEAKGLFVQPVKIVKYLGQLYFYSIGIFLCFALSAWEQHIPFRWQDPVVFPVLTNLWWFASVYFWMFLLHGFLNRLLQNLTQKDYRFFILLLLFCFSLIPTILRKSYHSELLWFIILYAIAGYIRKYGTLFCCTFKAKGWLYLLMGAIVFAVSCGLRTIGIVAEKSLPLLASHTESLGEMHNSFTFLISLFLFSAFLQFRINYNRWINLIASGTFGVYLIHDHPAVRNFLWQMLFRNHLFQNSAMIIPYSIFAVVCVYSGCTIIDFIRQSYVEPLFLIIVQRLTQYCAKPITVLRKHISNIF